MKLSAQQKKIFNKMATIKQSISETEKETREKKKEYNKLFESVEHIARQNDDKIITGLYALTFNEVSTKAYKVEANKYYRMNQVIRLKV